MAIAVLLSPLHQVDDERFHDAGRRVAPMAHQVERQLAASSARLWRPAP